MNFQIFTVLIFHFPRQNKAVHFCAATKGLVLVTGGKGSRKLAIARTAVSSLMRKTIIFSHLGLVFKNRLNLKVENIFDVGGEEWRKDETICHDMYSSEDQFFNATLWKGHLAPLTILDFETPVTWCFRLFLCTRRTNDTWLKNIRSIKSMILYFTFGLRARPLSLRSRC